MPGEIVVGGLAAVAVWQNSQRATGTIHRGRHIGIGFKFVFNTAPDQHCFLSKRSDFVIEPNFLELVFVAAAFAALAAASLFADTG